MRDQLIEWLRENDPEILEQPEKLEAFMFLYRVFELADERND